MKVEEELVPPVWDGGWRVGESHLGRHAVCRGHDLVMMIRGKNRESRNMGRGLLRAR